jgi:hypothetical protein
MEHLAVPALITIIVGLVLWIIQGGKTDQRNLETKTDKKLEDLDTKFGTRIHNAKNEMQGPIASMRSDLMQLAKDVGALMERSRIDELIDRKLKERQ